MTEKSMDRAADEIKTGVEDKFHYFIDGSCVLCGACAKKCPVGAISKGESRYEINPRTCIDCGSCSGICPTGAAQRTHDIRSSLAISEIDRDKCYFNPGCAMSLYRPNIPKLLLNLLQTEFEHVKLHTICCRHEPGLEAGSTIINNCAGCDRRFRSLYRGINTISLWEVLDSMEHLELPDYHGMEVSVHDSCGYRHKPQVHRAIRSLLQKMNLTVVEAPFSGTESICCGDNFYGYVPNEEVEKRIQMRADQFPCENVVVYCIGCVRAMTSGGKKPLYMPDLILNQPAEPMPDTLDEYHSRLSGYIQSH